jgi:hypothetical protein
MQHSRDLPAPHPAQQVPPHSQTLSWSRTGRRVAELGCSPQRNCSLLKHGQVLGASSLPAPQGTPLVQAPRGHGVRAQASAARGARACCRAHAQASRSRPPHQQRCTSGPGAGRARGAATQWVHAGRVAARALATSDKKGRGMQEESQLHRQAMPTDAGDRHQPLCCRTCTPAPGSPRFIGRSWPARAGLPQLQDINEAIWLPGYHSKLQNSKGIGSANVHQQDGWVLCKGNIDLPPVVRCRPAQLPHNAAQCGSDA